jgi:hypothetical protein
LLLFLQKKKILSKAFGVASRAWGAAPEPLRRAAAGGKGASREGVLRTKPTVLLAKPETITR